MIGTLGRLEDRSTGPTRAEKDRLVALFREHGLHRPGRRTPGIPLGLDGALVAVGDHLAYFWESKEELTAAVGFLAAGVMQGETCLLLGYDEANDRLEAALQSAGLDAEGLRREKRLNIIRAMRSAEALLEEVGEQVRSAVDRGAPLVRIFGNLGWGRPEWPGDREILRLEARVTDAVRRSPVVVMCAYDLRGLCGHNPLLGGLECHPLTYRRNTLRLNEHYVPVDRFLRGLPPGLD